MAFHASVTCQLGPPRLDQGEIGSRPDALNMGARHSDVHAFKRTTFSNTRTTSFTGLSHKENCEAGESISGGQEFSVTGVKNRVRTPHRCLSPSNHPLTLPALAPCNPRLARMSYSIGSTNRSLENESIPRPNASGKQSWPLRGWSTATLHLVGLGVSFG
jgi:hypothetical protein